MKYTNRPVSVLIRALKEEGHTFVFWDEYKKLIAYFNKFKIELYWKLTEKGDKDFPKIEVSL